MEKLVPKLRFPEFVEEWEQDLYKSVFLISAGGDIDKEHVSGVQNDKFKYPIYANAEKNKGFYGYSDIYKIDKKCVTIAGRGANFGIAHARFEKFVPIVRLLVLKPKKDSDIKFFEYCINTSDFHLESTGVPQLTAPQLGNYSISFPSLPEQTKIAEFLTAIDKRIELITAKKEKLTLYKKGVMQKIFNQEIRFKDENGEEFSEWTPCNAGDLFTSITNKNHNSDLPILAITQEHGAIPRNLIDYNISVSEKSVDSYKVVEKGDFIISLRSFQGGIEYSNYLGICSPAYIILKPKVAIVDQWFKYFFKTDSYIVQLNEKLEGIRDGKMISYKYFSETKINLPSVPEQSKISEFILSIDTQIQKVDQQITLNQTYKKGLLQQLFV